MSDFKPTDMNQRIGIDKIKFYKFHLDLQNGIDYSRLLCHECVQIEEAENGKAIRYLPTTHKGISKIIIKDNQVFSDLAIGCIRDGTNKIHEYIYLTITVDNARGDNLEPMSYKEYCLYLENVIWYIADTYGIYLQTDDMKVRYMELNTNIALTENFSAYSRGIKLLMSFPDKRYGKLSTYDSVSKKKKDTVFTAESYKRGNQSIEFVIYDKTKQMEDRKKKKDKSGDMPQYLRIEYRLLTPQKIKDELKSADWKNLNDNLIADWFINKWRHQIVEEYEAWKQERQKNLLKLIAKCRRKNPKNWHHLLMQEIRNLSELNGASYILDIEQVHEAVRNIPNSSKYYTRTIKAFDKIEIDRDIYRNHDMAKVEEIINGVELSYKTTWELACF